MDSSFTRFLSSFFLSPLQSSLQAPCRQKRDIRPPGPRWGPGGGLLGLGHSCPVPNHRSELLRLPPHLRVAQARQLQHRLTLPLEYPTAPFVHPSTTPHCSFPSRGPQTPRPASLGPTRARHPRTPSCCGPRLGPLPNSEAQ
jgi:hypothetical protein